jgi:hypothetical protein
MQTEYNTNFEQLMQGMLATNSVWEQITLLGKADVEFGMPVVRDGDEGAIATEASPNIVGIVRHEHNDKGLMVEGEALGVITKGTIAVPTEGAGIIAGDDANFNTATGKFTKVSTSATVLACGKFQSTVKNDTLAIIKIDILG